MRTRRNYRPALDGALEDRVALTVLPSAAFISAASVQQAINRNFQSFHVANPALLATPARFMPTLTLPSMQAPTLSRLTAPVRAATPTSPSVHTTVAAANPSAAGSLTSLASALRTTTTNTGSGLLSSIFGSTPTLVLPLPNLGLTNLGLTNFGTTTLATTTPVTSTAANGLGLSFNNFGTGTGLNLGSTALAGMGLGTTGSFGTNLGGTSNGFNTFGMSMI